MLAQRASGAPALASSGLLQPALCNRSQTSKWRNAGNSCPPNRGGTRCQMRARRQRRDRPLGIEPGPEDSQNKAGRDRWADVALHALQVNIKLTANQMDERH